uniref:Enoyl reductase (ER) domain-containing protein n=1 Tax=Zooxanthella nutricula TaxID=1333877 RepID=A0A6U6MWF2_9DINO
MAQARLRGTTPGPSPPSLDPSASMACGSSSADTMRGAVLRAKAQKPEGKVLYPGQKYDLIVSSIPKPRCVAGKALVRVVAAGVNPVDCKLILPSWIQHAFGRDYCGVVEEITEETSAKRGIKVGDTVMGMSSGSCCEYIVADTETMTKVPDNMTPEQAAGMGVAYMTSYDAIFAGTTVGRPPVGENTRVLIIGGSGGTGLAALQLARRCACARLVATVCSGRNEQLVKQEGADVVFDYTKIDFAATPAEELKRIMTEEAVKQMGTEEKRPAPDDFRGEFDLVYDCVSSMEDHDYRPVANQLLAPGAGHYVAINAARPAFWMQGLLARATGLGSWVLPSREDLFLPAPNREKVDNMSKWFGEGKLRVNVDTVVDFQKAASDANANLNEAIDRQLSRRATGKVVIGNIGSPK